PLHERHDVVRRRVDVPRIEEGDDVRVREPGRNADLAQKARRAVGPVELTAQHFDRDFAIVLGVVRKVDDRGAANAEESLDSVGRRERLLEVVERKGFVAVSAARHVAVNWRIAPRFGKLRCEALRLASRAVPTSCTGGGIAGWNTRTRPGHAPTLRGEPIETAAPRAQLVFAN